MKNQKNDLDMLKKRFIVDCDFTAEELIDFDLHIYITNKTAEEDIIPEVSGHEAVDVKGSPIKRKFLIMLQNQVSIKQWMLSLQPLLQVWS